MTRRTFTISAPGREPVVVLARSIYGAVALACDAWGGESLPAGAIGREA